MHVLISHVGIGGGDYDYLYHHDGEVVYSLATSIPSPQNGEMAAHVPSVSRLPERLSLGESDGLVSPSRVRAHFPETWLWFERKTRYSNSSFTDS